MRRREFIALVGGGVAWPLTVRAQQPTKVWRIGYLGAAQRMPVVDGFLEEMRALGYIEGKISQLNGVSRKVATRGFRSLRQTSCG
jgi:putative tryptophan/tyrosine transport system substrate-binding protein